MLGFEVMEQTGIGDFVRQKRTELGMTQAELADRAAISRARVAQIEGGRVTLPGGDHRRRIAMALGVTHLDLLIAAGEITREETGASAPSPEIDDDDELKLALLRAVRNVDWREAGAAAVGRSLMRTLLGVRQDQRQASARPEPSNSAQGH